MQIGDENIIGWIKKGDEKMIFLSLSRSYVFQQERDMAYLYNSMKSLELLRFYEKYGFMKILDNFLMELEPTKYNFFLTCVITKKRPYYKWKP